METGRQVLLNALTVRARSRRELAALLARKGVSPEAAEMLLERFSEVGLIDDEKFAEAWVEQRQQHKGLSRRALRAELQLKGVARDTISAAVGEVSDEQERAAALALAARKVGRMAALAPDVRRRRLHALLMRRGFDPALVGSVLAEVLGDVEDVGESC